VTFPLPVNEAAFLSELQRQLDARFVDEPAELEPAPAPSLFTIPSKAVEEIRMKELGLGGRVNAARVKDDDSAAA